MELEPARTRAKPARPAHQRSHESAVRGANNVIANELPILRRAERLGWLSLGLGLAEVAVPRAVAHAVGLRDAPLTRIALRLAGIRELAAGFGILGRARPSGWLWSRVAGDVMDIALLTLTPAEGPAGRRRARAATLSVLAITALDIAAASRVSRVDALHSGASVERKRVSHTQSITVKRPLDETRARWREFVEREGSRLADLRFVSAPGERGTELHARHGALDALHVKSVLRHFKQIVETGEVVRSDASIHLGPHAAQPSRRLESVTKPNGETR